MPDGIWFHRMDLPAHSGQVSGFVVRDEKFLAYPMPAVAVDAPSCRHHFLVEAFIEVSDERCVVIREHAESALVSELFEKVSETDMFLFAEAVFRVADEARFGEWCVRAVEEDEIAFFGVFDACGKVEVRYLGLSLLQETGKPLDVLPIVGRARAVIIGHVESPLPVDAEETVEAVLVEEDEGCGEEGIVVAFHSALVVGIADAVVAGLAFMAKGIIHIVKAAENTLVIHADGLVGVHQGAIDVVDVSMFGLQVQEECAATDEGLVVVLDGRWQVLLDDGQELPFPSYPLDEWFDLMHTVLSLSHVLPEW